MVLYPCTPIYTSFLWLTDRSLRMQAGYAWNGADWPAFNTENIIRASLVHDALYQLIHNKYLSIYMKDYADKEFKNICLEDGMGKIRAGRCYWAVKIFGLRPTINAKNRISK